MNGREEEDQPHIMFNTVRLRAVLSIISAAQMPGVVIYDRSVWLRPMPDHSYILYFSTFGAEVAARLPIESHSDQVVFQDMLLNIDVLFHVAKFSGENVVLYVRSDGVFASVLGGEVFIPYVFQADLTLYHPLQKRFEEDLDTAECLRLPVEEFSTILQFGNITRNYPSMQHKILYFSNTGAYAYVGSSALHYAAELVDFGLSPAAVSVARAYAATCGDEGLIYTTGEYILLCGDDMRVYLEQVVELLPKQVAQSFDLRRIVSCRLRYAHVAEILKVLIGAGSAAGGVVEIRISSTGIILSSRDRSGRQLSRFILGEPGEEAHKITVSPAPLAQFIGIFRAEEKIEIAAQKDTLILSAGKITALIAGRS